MSTSDPLSSAASVLVVEDDDGIRECVCEYLLELGWRAEGVSNGFLALERLRQGERPGLLLVDLMMPVLDGLSLIEILRADPTLRDIPIIVVTAMTPLPSGPFQVIGKPFHLDHLTHAVQRYLGDPPHPTPRRSTPPPRLGDQGKSPATA